MGTDGHTASLFPNTAALDERSRLVTFCRGPKVTPDRVTMTYRLLNGARVVMPLVCGADKAAMVARVARREESVREVPILGLSPTAGEMRWYLDADAASGERRPAADA
jgi:6-phosphogluconolactonase